MPRQFQLPIFHPLFRIFVVTLLRKTSKLWFCLQAFRFKEHKKLHSVQATEIRQLQSNRSQILFTVSKDQILPTVVEVTTLAHNDQILSIFFRGKFGITSVMETYRAMWELQVYLINNYWHNLPTIFHSFHLFLQNSLWNQSLQEKMSPMFSVGNIFKPN